MDAKQMIERTKLFGYDCIDICNYLTGSFLKNHIRGQLTRSSTSVSANYRAARLAQSRASFISKISIVVEETDESAMWLKMIIDKKLMSPNYYEELSRLKKEAMELTSMFISTRKTMTLKK